ncbi:class I SAM-dependent methyltransferase [Ferruginivarius sediminum]|uniref:class I SAM-dependent methyltransferase n=1 Tax=Ferruginivarius sediminum TaxID=2661937 RepID=UPI001F4DA698|nr:class I SAM-dependent methyltransferase [Ferruginivarius sediminum]
MDGTSDADDRDPVLAQYEAYPYPSRDPKDEKTRLIEGSPSHLDEIRHYLFGGRLDVTADFRALVAGGGTGDAAIMLAQQLSDAGGGEVVYVDLSRKAREIAEARAAARGLSNIAFHTGSLLDLPEMDLGAFDYIDCCGVLHHLEDPAAGAMALRRVLKDGGGIGLMVYAPFGRTGVYEMQAMLRTLGGDLPLAQRVAQARRLWDKLPQTNWLKRNPFVGDHKRSDAELVDLFLHARDRPYTVPEVAGLLDGADLRPAAFVEPLRYDPATYMKDPALLKPLADLDPVGRAAFAERLAGNMKKHIVYAVPKGRADTVAAIEDDTVVPVPSGLDPRKAAQGMGPNPLLKANFDGQPLRLPLPRLAGPLLVRIDGERSLGEIVAGVMAQDSTLEAKRVEAQFAETFRAFNGINRMFLRYPTSRM